MKYVQCPICSKEFKSLNTHVVYKHNMTLEQFKLKFPKCVLQVYCNDTQSRVCPYCTDGKLYKHPGLSVHIAYRHKGVKRLDPLNKTKRDKHVEEGYVCPICAKKTTSICQHVELFHKLDWEAFVKTYSWCEKKNLFSSKHRESLSENKKIFYNNTHRGAELKKQQSIANSGQNNFACSKEAREKQSTIMANRLKNQIPGDKTSNITGYGILVNYNNRVYRSLQEFIVVLYFEENNINFTYEELIIKYQDAKGVIRSYLADFKVDNNIFEIKADADYKNYWENYKYCQVKTACEQLGYTYNVLTPKQLSSFFNKPMLLPLAFKTQCKELLARNKVVFEQRTTLRRNAFFEELNENYKTNLNFICN